MIFDYDYKKLCKELADDLSLWMEYDGKISDLPEEVENSLSLLKRTYKQFNEVFTMTKQITIEQALELVDFEQDIDGVWFVKTVKGDCGTVRGYCGLVEGYCGTVKGYCDLVESNCGTVKGYCDLVDGNCGTIKGRVDGTINGRQWQYVETPREKMWRLIEEGASKEMLLNALEELND